MTTMMIIIAAYLVLSGIACSLLAVWAWAKYRRSVESESREV